MIKFEKEENKTRYTCPNPGRALAAEVHGNFEIPSFIETEQSFGDVAVT